MGGILGSILSAVVSALLPVLLGFLKSKLPQADRAQARQWVKDMLVELVNGLNAHGLVPVFFQSMEDPVETLFATAINGALDKAGW